eukprot:SAG31_NODE_353_length_17229_cov_8.702160_16_plen_114_part_00
MILVGRSWLALTSIGYGKGERTSSTKPQKMESLENKIISQVACGHSHTLLLLVDESEDRLAKLPKFKPKMPKVRLYCFPVSSAGSIILFSCVQRWTQENSIIKPKMPKLCRLI